MIRYNFELFMVDKRVTLKELAQHLGVSLVGMQKMKNRGTIKISMLKRIEEVYGDCSQYLSKEKAEAV